MEQATVLVGNEIKPEVNVYALERKVNSLYNKIIKRVIDLFLSILLFIVTFPLFLIISVLIAIDSGFPIFYRADRGGYNNKVFRIFKFRTMVKNADQIGGGTTALNDSRITRTGKILRKTKLDEIPQLINIIKGDMSFIGPRPELVRYTSQYAVEEKYILRVRPGITDYSSLEFISLDEIVGSENADEIYEKFVLKKKNALRIKYVIEQSFWVDLKLFTLTVINVLKKAVGLLTKKKVKIEWNT